MKVACRAIVAVLVSAPLLASPVAAQTFSTVVSAPDGTLLATDVYLPLGDPPWPSILIRTPYGKGGHALDCLMFTLAGYACVVQDTRGRFDSGGTDTVFRDDGPDGRATVAWVADQDWCNGSIGTFGGSAVGITQYALAAGADPALKCQLAAVATPNLRDHAFLQGGALRTALVETWLADQGSLEQLDEVTAHRLLGDWWEPLDFVSGTPSVHAAGLHVGGWYDIFQQGTLDAFATSQRSGGEGARGRQHLIMGPWTHGGDAGELEYLRVPGQTIQTVSHPRSSESSDLAPVGHPLIDSPNPPQTSIRWWPRSWVSTDTSTGYRESLESAGDSVLENGPSLVVRSPRGHADGRC